MTPIEMIVATAMVFGLGLIVFKATKGFVEDSKRWARQDAEIQD